MFGPIRQLPLHSFAELGLIDLAVSNHMEATNDKELYQYTPPSPTSQHIGHVPKPKSTRGKVIFKRKTPIKIVTKSVGALKNTRSKSQSPFISKSLLILKIVEPIPKNELTL